VTTPASHPTLFESGLFEDQVRPGPARRSAPPCSSNVAAQMIAKSRGRLCRKVFAAIAKRGDAGATDEELQSLVGLRVQTETPRRRELVLAGLVRDSGNRRPTSSGRPATVWVTTGITSVPPANLAMEQEST